MTKFLDLGIKEIQRQPHCANCGKINPGITPYAKIEKGGLTACCHEEICCHLDDYIFGNDSVGVKACCWAIAEKMFKVRNIDIHQLPGISRRQMNEGGSFE
jgi:hypothetical protein